MIQISNVQYISTKLNADGYPSWNNLVVLWAQNEFMLQINIGLEFFIYLFASIFY